MSQPFDPIHVWLGIPPVEQPPHYYRLLGLRLFEPDSEVIENAAQRLAMHVSGFRSGPYQAAAEHLLNEVRQAHVTLFSPDLRSRYDEALDRALRGPLPTPASSALPVRPIVVHVSVAPAPSEAPLVVSVPVEQAVASTVRSTGSAEPIGLSRTRLRELPAANSLLPHFLKIVLGGAMGLALG